MIKEKRKINKNSEINILSDIDDFISSSLVINDYQKASKLVEEQAGLIFDMKYGKDILKLENDLASLEGPYKQSSKQLEIQEHKLLMTSPYIKKSDTEKQKNEKKYNDINKIKIIDISLICITVFLGITVTTLGAINIYTVIISSGTPVFIENPIMAMMISGLLPIGSTSLKFFSVYLPHDRAKKIYTITIYILSTILLLLWIILFGLTFKSSANGIDWNDFSNTKDNSITEGTYLTIVQLLAEMFVGTTLFIVAGDICSQYMQKGIQPNPMYEEHKKNHEKIKNNHDNYSKIFKEKKSEIEFFRLNRKAYINKQLIEYIRSSARINGIDNLSSHDHKEDKSMKNKILSIALMSSILLALTSNVYANEILIGVSPIVDHKTGKKQNIELLKFLTEKIEPGDQAIIFDAWNIETIGTFKVPNKSTYENKKAKLSANSDLVRKILNIGTKDHPLLSETTNGAIKIPQFLEFLGMNYGPFDNKNILLFGSPIYVDMHSPQLSMTGGRIAEDYHFSLPRSSTPFSVVGKETLLKGSKVHFYITDPKWAKDEQYAYLVRRMWSIFILKQGGSLVTFTHDSITAAKRATTKGFYKQSNERPKNTPKNIRNKNDMQENELDNLQRLRKPSLIPQILLPGKNVRISITWDCMTCDLDLYVKPDEDKHIIYFGSRKTPVTSNSQNLGVKDHQKGQYETIGIDQAMSLSQSIIAINWYSGFSSKGINGKIQLSNDNQTYIAPFHIEGQNGNFSSGLEETFKMSRAANSQWKVIFPETLIGY